MSTPGARSGWPVGDGEMAGRIRAFDWASTPLGSIDTWPSSLRTVVDMMLASPQAMWVAWGPELIQLYNDSYIPLLDEARHPSILGRPSAEAWAESWYPWGPALQSILAGGPPVSYTDRRIPQRHDSDLRDRYFTYNYSAIPDPSVPGGVGGVWCVSLEITSSIALHESEERQAFLLRLSDALRPLSDPIAIQETAARTLGERLGVSHVAYGEVDGDDMVVARDYVAGDSPSAVGRYRMADFGEKLLTAVREGRTVVVPDISTSDQLLPAEREAYAAMGIAALTAVPLVKQGRFVANLNVHHTTPRAWTGSDIALVEETAERTWAAVERARAEAALRESEARFRSVWEATSEALAISAPDGTVLAANPAYLTLYGYDEADVVGRSFAVIFPEEQRAWAEEQYRDIFASPELPPPYLSPVRRKDGSERVVEARADFVVDLDGQRTAMISAIRDVTDRFAAEDALRASEAAYRTLFTAMDQGFCVLEKVDTAPGHRSDYRFVSANPAFARHTGMHDVVGKTILELAPGVESGIIDICDDVVRSGQTRRFEAHVAEMDLWVDAEVIPSRESGQIAVLFSNVSDRKRTQATLHESEERQAFLLMLADTLRPLSDASEIKATAARLLGQHLSANRAYYGDIDDTEVDIEYEYSVDGPPFSGRRALGVWTEPVLDAYRRGQTLIIDDVHTHALFAGEDRSAYDAAGIRGGIGVPLVKDGVWRAVLGVMKAEPRVWTPAEVRLVEEVADRTWAAVERARAEVALRASEERLRALVTATSYIIYRMSPDWSEMRQLDGRGLLADTETPSRGWLTSYIEPEDRARVLDAIQEAIRASDVFELEHRVRRTDGTVTWTLSRAVPILDARGDIVEWFGAASDVSDRKQAEAALQESEERYRTLFESIDQGFCTIEVLFSDDGRPVDYVFREINPSFARNTGLVDAVGRRMRDLAPAHEEHWFETYGRVALTGVAERFEAEAAALGRWYSVYAYRIGEPAEHRVAILFEDITQRREAEEALRTSEERFRALAHLSPGFLWEGDADGAAVWFNDRWYEYTGRTEAEALGWGWSDVIHPEDRPHSMAAAERSAERGEPLRLEHRIRAADGSYCWFQVRAEPLRDADGTIVRWFGAATDIHEARKARDDLEDRVAAATAELRSLSQRLLMVQEEERRHLSQELHDEIGQVLTGLSLNLRPSAANQDERLEEARRIVHDLTNQVRQLSLDLRPAALDSHGLLPALVWHVERYQNRTGVHVDLRHEGMERRFPPAVEITAYRVVQEALTNVARHAGIRDATVQLLATDVSLVVSVRDRGKGFDPGARTDSSGLSGMRERVRLVGGTLSIDTASGEGTVVTAELLIAPPVPAGTSGEEP